MKILCIETLFNNTQAANQMTPSKLSCSLLNSYHLQPLDDEPVQAEEGDERKA